MATPAKSSIVMDLYLDGLDAQREVACWRTSAMRKQVEIRLMALKSMMFVSDRTVVDCFCCMKGGNGGAGGLRGSW